MVSSIFLEEKDYLFIKHSQIASAGNGLFSTIEIKPNRIIARYFGEMISLDEAQLRAKLGKGEHFIKIDDQHIIDCYDTPGFAKYANDAESLTNPTNFKNNAAIVRVPGIVIPVLASTTQIYPGQEIFVGYGNAYWQGHLNNTQIQTKSFNGMIWI